MLLSLKNLNSILEYYHFLQIFIIINTMKMISTIESIINNTINQTLLFQKSEFSLEEFDLLSQINKQKKIIFEFKFIFRITFNYIYIISN